MVGSTLSSHSKITTVATQHKNVIPSLIFSSEDALKVNLHQPSKVPGYHTCFIHTREIPQEKSCCGTAPMQKSFILHIVCVPFCRKKIQSSLTPIYLEPHKGNVITSYWQEDTAFFCQHSFRTCRLNCQFFHWPWTACEPL